MHFKRACDGRPEDDLLAALGHAMGVLADAPGDRAARATLAALLEAAGHPGLGCEIHNITVRENPLDPVAWHDRAGLRMRRGDLDGALSDLRLGLLARPDHAPSLSLQARILRNLGRRREARDVEGKLAAIRPHA